MMATGCLYSIAENVLEHPDALDDIKHLKKDFTSTYGIPTHDLDQAEASFPSCDGCWYYFQILSLAKVDTGTLSGIMPRLDVIDTVNYLAGDAAAKNLPCANFLRALEPLL